MLYLAFYDLAEKLLLNRSFEPSQPLGITSGLKETSKKNKKKPIGERTNKAAIRPEKQSEKTESCREILCNTVE